MHTKSGTAAPEDAVANAGALKYGAGNAPALPVTPLMDWTDAHKIVPYSKNVA